MSREPRLKPTVRVRQKPQAIWASDAKRLGLDGRPLKGALKNAFTLVNVREVWFESPVGDRWLAAYRLIPRHGHPVIAELRLFPIEPGKHDAGHWGEAWLGPKAKIPAGGITARLLRQVRVGEHAGHLDGILENMKKQFGVILYEPKGVLGRLGFVADAPLTPKLGRKPLPDVEYARIAVVYDKALRAGNRRPVVAVAKAWRIPIPKARDVIHRARERGMLTPASKQGRASGGLTSRAQAFLSKLYRKGGKHDGTKR